MVVETRTVGQFFATCGVIRDARSRRKLAEGRDCPYGFSAAAYDAAVSLAESRGWTVVNGEES